jgi:hypothetical protein
MLILVVISGITNHPQHSITENLGLPEKYYWDEILYYPDRDSQLKHSEKLINEPTN